MNTKVTNLLCLNGTILAGLSFVQALWYDTLICALDLFEHRDRLHGAEVCYRLLECKE